MRLCTYFSWIMFAVIRCLKSTINTARQCHKPSQSELDKYQKGIIRHFCWGTIWYIWYSWSWHTETFFAVALFDIFDIVDLDIQKLSLVWHYLIYLIYLISTYRKTLFDIIFDIFETNVTPCCNDFVTTWNIYCSISWIVSPGL